MGLGRVLSATATAAAVAGCAALAVGMARATPAGHPDAQASPAIPSYSPTRTIPAFRMVTAAPATSSAAASSSGADVPIVAPSLASSAAASSAGRSSAASSTAATSARPSPRSYPAPRSSGRSSTTAPPPPHSSSTSHPAPPPAPRGSSLPLGFTTSTATRVVTVVAHSYSSTTATLQAWSKASGGGWLRVGPSITAHVGSQGLTTAPSEFRSATPIGSFTLTQAFGHYANPGTPLPYFQTNDADWWISQSGPLYNTHQHCWSNCPFNQGSPNEHLARELPFYNYAVVINTPSGSSAYPHGSAFFLHVTDGAPTAGCVAIPQTNLVSIMKWLSPSAHPRILIGVA